MDPRGTLYLVATPIGHLGDISDRAKDILAQVAVVAAEDTRRTRQLLTHLQLSKKLISVHGHNEASRINSLRIILDAGDDIALVSDGGTPLISDPGERLVSALTEQDYEVISVPGPCAAIVALTVSGLPADRFTFVGFLPRAGGKANKALEDLLGTDGTLIFYESPRRVLKTVERMLDLFGDRRAVLCRELTKKHEEVVRGQLSDLQERAEQGLRGEVVLLVEGAGAVRLEQNVDEEQIEQGLIKGEKMRDLAHEISRKSGLSSQAAYAKVMAIKNRLDMKSG